MLEILSPDDTSGGEVLKMKEVSGVADHCCGNSYFFYRFSLTKY